MKTKHKLYTVGLLVRQPQLYNCQSRTRPPFAYWAYKNSQATATGQRLAGNCQCRSSNRSLLPRNHDGTI